MSTKRIRHTAKFKFQIAVEAIKPDKTINQLASEHQLHPSQISQWKKQLLEQGSDIFATPPTKGQREQNDRESSLYEQIGRLNMELDWLKKKAASNSRTETNTR
jgi:putative transposase